MAAISTQDLYYAYLAYFGRPPDATGLLSFADATEAEVVAAFSASQESIDLLAGVTTSDQINNIYLNVLNRDAEPAGLLFWLNEITLGNITLAEAALAIVRAALLTADAPTVTAKYNAQVAFVDALDTTPEIIGYQGTEAAADARAWLATVDKDNIPTPAEVDAAVLVATTPYVAPPPPPPTFDITPSATSINEGQAVVFTITTDAAPGTLVSYTLSGVTLSDLQFGVLAGTVTVDGSGQATVQVNLANDNTTENTEYLTITLSDGTNATVEVLDTSTTPVVPPVVVVGVTKVATDGIDILDGTSANDTFVATGTTLQNGDVFNGLGGSDRLNISFSGNSGFYYDGFETNSVELISVKNLASDPVWLDLSDVNYDDTQAGSVTLESRESADDVVFWDVQSINNTDLQIVDTEYDTYYWYDAGSSAVNDNGDGTLGDIAEIAVGEMRGTTRSGDNWYTDLNEEFAIDTSGNDGARSGVDGAGVYLGNTANFYGTAESYVDVVHLQSGITGQTSPTLKNTIELTSGEDLDTLIINGSADLEITNTLDMNIRVVDAGEHLNGSADLRADLILDLSNSSDGLLFADANAYWTDDATQDGYVSGDPEDQVSGLVGLLDITGSQGDDLITTGITHNDKNVDLGTGNDTLVAAGWIEPHDGLDILWGGEAKVDGGTGNDVIVTGNLNDSVVGGEGNDNITDGGSTSLNTRNTNYFHGEALKRYDADVSTYGNQFDLGLGNDTLTVFGALNLLGDSASLQERQSVSGSNNTVSAGEGDDSVYIEGSAIDGVIQANQGNVWDRIDTIVDLGKGNDVLYIGDASMGREDDAYQWDGSRGNVSVNGGDGNDFIGIARDGNQTVYAGEGNDRVEILQDENEFSDNHYDGSVRDGNHKIWLGSGDDSLLITGRSEVAVSSKTTDIDAGTGNDFVEIEQDHRLNVKLGEGDDTLMMRAQDLQSNDTIQGGDNYMADTVNGYDTIVLTNESHQVFYGEVRDSETRHVFAVEQFNLLDSEIRLHITDNLVETALNQTVVVDTTGASRGEFPIDLRDSADVPETQGMLWSDWVYYYGSDIPGLDHIRTPNPADPDNSAADLMFATYEDPIPKQTIDLTKLNTVDYTFELRGGGLRDVVVVDEDALSADLYLDFDSNGDIREGWSNTDTLQVVDGAALRAADLENVNDLEIIELVASSNIAQDWTIELNNHVINQPTALEPLVIRIDPNVPAGSNVYIVFSENNTSGATNDVIVERNSNVHVYIVTDQGALDWEVFLAQEDQYNTNVPEWHFNNSQYKVVVKTAQFFTDNADNLHGTEADDTFIADTLDQVQEGDDVDGNPEFDYPGNNVIEGNSDDRDFDTVELRFAVAAQANALQGQLSNANLWDIEHIQFLTENQVQMTGLEDWWQYAETFAADLTHLTTGSSSDRLQLIERSGLWFTLNEGNDYLSFVGGNQETMAATVSGGTGLDSVIGTTGEDSFVLGSVEYVSTGDGEDEVTFSLSDDRWGDSLGGNDGNVAVDGGSGEDTLNLDDDGTNGVVTVSQVETINGGDGEDVIDAVMNDDNSMYVYGNDSNDSIRAQSSTDSYVYVSGGDGNDWLSANNANGSVMVDGDAGADTIIAGWATPNAVTVRGGTGNDNITVRANDTVWVEGNADSDVINVAIGGALSGSDSMASGTVWGDSASGADSVGSADTINVQTNDAVTVYGGGGNDLITVNSDADGGASTYVYGQNGNDTINVQGDANTFINAGGDSGNDLINLQALGSGVDTIVFGNIGYSALQAQNLNTQGVDVINNFNFENGPGPDTAAPGQDDVLDFSAFLVGSSTDDFQPGGGSGNGLKYADWTSGTTTLDMDNWALFASSAVDSKVAIITVDTDFSAQDLRDAISLDWEGVEDPTALGAGPNGDAGTLQLDDGSRTVVILAKDSDPADAIVGYDLFEVYYVQDIDTSGGAGTLGSAVWAVDLVATINSTTAVGSTQGSVGANQFVW